MNNTHMPFLSRCGAEEISLCCRKVNGFWKLHQKVGDDWVRLNTQRPDDATECSPTAEYQDGKWHISFIAGGAEGDRLFRMYTYVDGVVTLAKEPAYAGFVNRKMLVYGGREKQFTIELAGGAIKKIFNSPGLEELFRISYDASRPHRLLISGRYHERICSWIFDLSNDNLHEVEADGNPAYKCAFIDGKCYYAKQVGDGFEDREVFEASVVKITPLSKDIFTVAWERNNNGM